MNDELYCGHISAAAFLPFSGQLRTTSAEDFHKRERGERERERGREGGGEAIMSAEDNALNTTFSELGSRRKTEKIEI